MPKTGASMIQWTEQEWLDAVRRMYPQQGELIRKPRFWHDAAYNNPSQPVVGVCWYEAMAYASWLAAVTGQPYRLPSEPEWEWAARRGGRQFPWGSGWDSERLNSLEGENRVMRTTPVGAYPLGATPDGIYDLAGNVWEWTATRYAKYPYRPEAKSGRPGRDWLANCPRRQLGGKPQNGAVRLSLAGTIPGAGTTAGDLPRQDPLSLSFCLLTPAPCPLIFGRTVRSRRNKDIRPAGPIHFGITRA